MMTVSSRLKDDIISKILDAVEGQSIADVEFAFKLALDKAKKVSRFHLANIDPETSEACSE